MADTKITDLGELTAVATGDLIEIVDVSDTSMSADGTNKKITQTNLIPDSSATVKGKVELATNAETLTGTDTERAVTPDGLQDKISFANINAPQGFLVNGKIVPSVASNNLTVAIKGLDGNDASASNPIYCRIGDTIRSITSALSVTKNAGTNWSNAGSAGLATKEIDYFVYLGYNATDGVVIGFSRIPYANEYDDFSATTTNEKYCAISTITTAAAGDDYENIGRFAATLASGTSSYTWSVPTFTAKNLIQRPIFETRWLLWLPTYSGTGSMSYTSVTTTYAQYKILGKKLELFHRSTGTTGGSASNGILLTLPFSSASVYPTYAINVGDTALNGGGFSYFNSVSQIAGCKQTEANWGIGASRRVDMSISYEI